MTDKELLLFESAENGDGFKFIELMEEGVNLNCCNEEGLTPLMVYLEGGYGSVEVVKLAIIKGAEINAKDSNGDTILDIAKFMDLQKIVNHLISKGAQGANGKSYREHNLDVIYDGFDQANAVKKLFKDDEKNS